MNNIKKIALGSIVAAFAFGFSAFTSTPTTQKTGTFLVQNSQNNWVVRTMEPGGEDCAGSEQLQCYYEVKTAIPSQTNYDASEIDSYLNSVPAKIAAGVDSSPALYTGP